MFNKMYKSVWMIGLIALFGLLLNGSGCSPATPQDEATQSNDGGTSSTTDKDTIEDTKSVSCFTDWENIKDYYADATALRSCEGNEKAKKIVESLFNLSGVTIDNNGTTLTPCIETRCTDEYVYIASNNIPHYDFVQTTPNVLRETNTIYRLPYTPKTIASNVDADTLGTISACQDAYTQYLTNSSSGTQREPSLLCTQQSTDKLYLTEEINGKKVFYHKLSCLGTTAFVINGATIAGPNEGPMPDAWGNPLFYMPDKGDQSYLPTNLQTGAALDLCLGHTGGSMHYHGINEACFLKDASRKPTMSYAKAAQQWDWQKSLSGECTEVSGVVGWSLDGVPIKGPCVCVKRNDNGSCASIKRVRSSFVYSGLKEWGTDSKEDASLGKEGTSCTADSDCCTGTNCDFKCKLVVVDDTSALGGTKVGKRCALLDYSWCTHRYIERSKQDVSQTNFVYLDRCNGFESADGYAYHAIASFPLINSCYRFKPSLPPQTDPPGNGGPGNGGPGNGNPPKCGNGQTSMCCGDNLCGGPENSTNCPEDCP